MSFVNEAKAHKRKKFLVMLFTRALEQTHTHTRARTHTLTHTHRVLEESYTAFHIPVTFRDRGAKKHGAKVHGAKVHRAKLAYADSAGGLVDALSPVNHKGLYQG